MARDDVVLPFNGDEFTLTGKQIFKTARVVEPVLTITEMQMQLSRGAVPFSTIAEAYSIALRKAGKIADPEDVLEWLYEGSGTEQMVFVALERLGEIMVPPSARRMLERSAGSEVPKEDPTQKPRPSSKASTKSR